jgi:hypothetical protein
MNSQESFNGAMSVSTAFPCQENLSGGYSPSSDCKDVRVREKDCCGLNSSEEAVLGERVVYVGPVCQVCKARIDSFLDELPQPSKYCITEIGANQLLNRAFEGSSVVEGGMDATMQEEIVCAEGEMWINWNCVEHCDLARDTLSKRVLRNRATIRIGIEGVAEVFDVASTLTNAELDCVIQALQLHQAFRNETQEVYRIGRVRKYSPRESQIASANGEVTGKDDVRRSGNTNVTTVKIGGTQNSRRSRGKRPKQPRVKPKKNKPKSKASGKSAASSGLSAMNMKTDTARMIVAMAHPNNPAAVGAQNVTYAAHTVPQSARMRITVDQETGEGVLIGLRPTVCNDRNAVVVWKCNEQAGGADTLDASVNVGSAYEGWKLAGLRYSTADLGVATSGAGGVDATKIEGRVVSFGGHIAYTGSELKRGGKCYWLEPPHHQSLATNTTTQSALKGRIMSARQLHDHNFTSKVPFEFSVHPHVEAQNLFKEGVVAAVTTMPQSLEYPYSSSASQWGGAGVSNSTDGNNCGLIYIAPSTDDRQFELVLTEHVEYRGQTLIDQAHTPASDVHDGNLAIQALRAAKIRKADAPHRPLLHHFQEEWKKATKQALQKGGGALLAEASRGLLALTI